METRRGGTALQRWGRLVAMSLVLVAGMNGRAGMAAATSPLNDAWAGDKLDPKWHLTVMGDAQTEPNEITVQNGTLKIHAGGTEFFSGTDNGLFLWQPANGDFAAILEVRSITKISDSLNSSKIGILVRPTLDTHGPDVFCIAMPKGTHLQFRPDEGADEGPSSGDAGRLDWGDDTGNGPTMLLRLTRVGDKFTSARSFDNGKTWGRLHDDAHPDTDTVEVKMGDDVLVGIGCSAIHGTSDTTMVDALVGPFQFTQTAARPTQNGLFVGTAVDANGKPLDGSFLIVKKGTDVVGTTKTDLVDGNAETGYSDTASFFLPPGQYTVEAGETDMNNAGTPVPFEIKTGLDQIQDLKVPAGKAK